MYIYIYIWYRLYSINKMKRNERKRDKRERECVCVVSVFTRLRETDCNGLEIRRIHDPPEQREEGISCRCKEIYCLAVDSQQRFVFFFFFFVATRSLNKRGTSFYRLSREPVCFLGLHRDDKMVVYISKWLAIVVYGKLLTQSQSMKINSHSVS